MKTATKVRDLSDWTGRASLYKLSEPMDGEDTAEVYTYVVVSAAVTLDHGPETYIFPSNEKGDVSDWGELRGSYVGGMSHERALMNAGYEVVQLALPPGET